MKDTRTERNRSTFITTGKSVLRMLPSSFRIIITGNFSRRQVFSAFLFLPAETGLCALRWSSVLRLSYSLDSSEKSRTKHLFRECLLLFLRLVLRILYMCQCVLMSRARRD